MRRFFFGIMQLLAAIYKHYLLTKKKFGMRKLAIPTIFTLIVIAMVAMCNYGGADEVVYFEATKVYTVSGEAGYEKVETAEGPTYLIDPTYFPGVVVKPGKNYKGVAGSTGFPYAGKKLKSAQEIDENE